MNITKKDFLKENFGIVFLSILLLFLSFFSKDPFFVFILLYIYIIKFLVSDLLKRKTKKYLAIIIWIAFLVGSVSMVYVNYYLPHGPSYPTGDIICQNDDRGPCGEEYKEDLRGLKIPNWAKSLRENGIISLVALAFAGICAGATKESLE